MADFYSIRTVQESPVRLVLLVIFKESGAGKISAGFIIRIREQALLAPRHTHLDGTSQTTGTLLMVAITLLLAALVLAMLWLPSLFIPSDVPAIFQITSVIHSNEHGILNYDSRVVLQNTGTTTYPNKYLRAVFLKNGEPVNCRIQTVNGHDFISTAHIGVQTMGGTDCQGTFWGPGERIALDFTDGTFHPGDIISAEIYDLTTNLLISRHNYKA
jgi:hypothetical protein